jgi:hypothetical protein
MLNLIFDMSAVCCILGSVFSCACGQSYFSMRGLGEESHVSDAASAGQGGLFSLSPRNPAYPVLFTGTDIRASVLLLGNYARNAQGQRLLGEGRPIFFRTRIPLPLNFRSGLGFAEWYNQDFDVYSESLTYRRHVIGHGGIYDLDVSLARSFSQAVNVAVEYGYLFGASSELWRFDEYIGNFVTLDTIAYRYSGHAVRLGLAGKFSWFQASAIVEQVLFLNALSRVCTHGAIAESSTARVSFPARFGVGLCVTPTESWKFSLDVLTEPDSGRLRIADAQRPLFKNALRVVLGGEYLLDERHPLRFGLLYQDWYLKAAGGKTIGEIGVSMGSSLPLARLGSFDYALEYTSRGTQDLRENILRASLTLFFEEPWKKRTRNWGY